MSLLTDQELYDLTRAKRPHYQARVLDKSGIKYIRRIDGSIATTHEAVNAALISTGNPDGVVEGPRLNW